MKTMLSTVLVVLGLTFGASAFAAEPVNAKPVAAAHGVQEGRADKRDEKRAERKHEHRKHDKARRHAHKGHHRHPRRGR